jgi:predicted nucleic acid-binding protein
VILIQRPWGSSGGRPAALGRFSARIATTPPWGIACLALRMTLKNIPVYLSVITEAELFAFPQLSDDEAEHIEKFLRTVSIVPMDSQIARLTGTIRKTYQLKIADSVIAATALFTNAQLLTRNVGDFKKIPELILQEI